MVTFLRCVVANKATLLGYMLLLLFVLELIFPLETLVTAVTPMQKFALEVAELVAIMSGPVGACLLNLTRGGVETYMAYRRAISIAQAQKRVCCRGTYCSQVGVRLALRDFARESR